MKEPVVNNIRLSRYQEAVQGMMCQAANRGRKKRAESLRLAVCAYAYGVQK